MSCIIRSRKQFKMVSEMRLPQELYHTDSDFAD